MTSLMCRNTWAAVAVTATLLLLLAVNTATALKQTAPHSGIPLTLLSDPKAKCMDGTQSGYYVRPGTGRNATRFVINLEGGGECAREKSCKSKLNTALGSSKYFPKEMGSFGQYQDFNCMNNPLLCGWTMVFVPYCSQDLHSGRVSAPSSNTWGLYFSGAHVFHAVISDLERWYNFAGATDVVLTGQSAGGIGVWYHLDWLAERVPNARVVGAPIAGFYFPAYPYTGRNHTASGLADFRPKAWPKHYRLWNSTVDEDCYNAHVEKPWLCMLSNVSYDFISTPAFITEAQTDKVVILYHDWMPPQHLHQPPEHIYLQQWHANMTQGLQRAVVSPRDGVFNPACFIHTSFSVDKPLIKGDSFLSAFNRWFTTGKSVALQDDCGVMCNPTCPSS